jgi:hypothetical protein
MEPTAHPDDEKIDPLVIQPIANRYINYAFLATPEF